MWDFVYCCLSHSDKGFFSSFMQLITSYFQYHVGNYLILCLHQIVVVICLAAYSVPRRIYQLISDVYQTCDLNFPFIDQFRSFKFGYLRHKEQLNISLALWWIPLMTSNKLKPFMAQFSINFTFSLQVCDGDIGYWPGQRRLDSIKMIECDATRHVLSKSANQSRASLIPIHSLAKLCQLYGFAYNVHDCRKFVYSRMCVALFISFILFSLLMHFMRMCGILHASSISCCTQIKRMCQVTECVFWPSTVQPIIIAFVRRLI